MKPITLKLLKEAYTEKGCYDETKTFSDYFNSFDEFVRCYNLWKQSSFDSFNRFVDYYLNHNNYYNN